jgi:nucleotide-binding universal stress UspA family protein
MWDMSPRKVLVAVESAECDAALAYAAAEARRRRCGVHLVHVAPPVYGGALARADSVKMLNGELHRIGTKVLADASIKVEHELSDDDDLTVSTELCHGAVVPSLVTESIHACLVVVQHRGMGVDGCPPVMSVTNGVAARAHTPVVAVPAGWRPAPEAVPMVTVGVEDAETSAEVVRIALGAASRANGRIRLVHACDTRQEGDPSVAGLVDVETARRLRAELSEGLADILSAHPDVPVEMVVSEGEPAEALLMLVTDSDLLVVGRRHPRLPLASHLGPVARTVLRWSPIPVLVVDPVTPDARRLVEAPDLATAAIP